MSDDSPASGKKFLGERREVRPGAVIAHREPAGEALVNLMHAIAGGSLRHLRRLGVGIAMEHLFEQRRLRQYLPEQLRLDPETAPLALNDGTNRSVAGTQDYRGSNESLPARNAYFSRCSIAHHCNEGNHPGGGEVYEFDRLVRFPEYISRFQWNEL